MSAGPWCSQMESRCHRGSGRVSVGGVHGVGRRYPGVPVFKQLLSSSELARRCQTCGPRPRILRSGRGRGPDCPSSSRIAVWSARCGSVRDSVMRGFEVRRSVSGMWRRSVRGEVLDMIISRVSRVPRVSVDRRGFHIFPRHVGPGTWYPCKLNY